MPTLYDSLTKPTLLLDEERVRRNICWMKAKADKLGLEFRPHFKTHQSAVVGEWFRELGIGKITVSSVDMAAYFAQSGFEDITLAFPVNIREMEQINRLAEQVALNLLVDSVETVEYLNQRLRAPAGFFVKVDTGYQRAGIPWQDTEFIAAVIRKADPGKLRLRGLLTHEGRTYRTSGIAEVQQVHAESLQHLGALKQELQKEWPGLMLSYGDTPTASLMADFGPVDELRPGNLVFYDLMQQAVGSCDFSDIAVAMACPVVARYEARKELVLYGGAVHFSKDALQDTEKGTIFGRVVDYDAEGWGDPYPDVYMTRLSQEHGIVRAPEGFIRETRVGDLLLVLPVHSCLTADLMPGYVTLTGQRIPKMAKS